MMCAGGNAAGGRRASAAEPQPKVSCGPEFDVSALPAGEAGLGVRRQQQPSLWSASSSPRNGRVKPVRRGSKSRDADPDQMGAVATGS
jgi:hypothetical protein